VSAPFSHLARPSLTALLPNGLAVRPLALAIFVALAALACRRVWRRQDRALWRQETAPLHRQPFGGEERRKIATHVVDNSGDRASLERQVDDAWADLQRRSREAAAGELRAPP
jgi:hypothetical protein